MATFNPAPGPDITSGSGWRYLADSWVLDWTQDMIDITSLGPTPNEFWTHTDAAGHEHRYDWSSGYSTLNHVIDESEEIPGYFEQWGDDPDEGEWIDGYTRIIADHYECKLCGEHITPTMDPPGMVKRIPGMVTCTIIGARFRARAVGRHVPLYRFVVHLTPEEYAEIKGTTTEVIAKMIAITEAVAHSDSHRFQVTEIVGGA